MLVPIAAVVMWMGVYPESFLAPMRADIASLDARLAASAPESDSKLVVGTPTGKAANEVSHHEEHSDDDHSNDSHGKDGEH